PAEGLCSSDPETRAPPRPLLRLGVPGELGRAFLLASGPPWQMLPSQQAPEAPQEEPGGRRRRLSQAPMWNARHWYRAASCCPRRLQMPLVPLLNSAQGSRRAYLAPKEPPSARSEERRV